MKRVYFLIVLGLLLFSSSLSANKRYVDRQVPLVSEEKLLHKTSNIRELITDCLERSKSLSCHRAGVWFINERKDYSKGIGYLDASCQLGRGYSCTLIGSYYQRGEGVNASYSKAREYYNKGCLRYSDMGCKKYKLIKKAPTKKTFFQKLVGG
jgi:TPR repeat protein